MPAPTPGNVELSVGLAQWGAETETSPAMSNETGSATLLELARPLPTAKTKAAMCETLATAAQAHELPVGFFVRLINQESGFNPEVVSPAGAQGVAQFMPKVAEEWGLKNPFDPHAALIASARFLRSLYDQFGNWGLAAAAYNGGMGRVQKWIDKRGKLPDETRHYVMTITGVPADKWADGKPQSREVQHSGARTVPGDRASRRCAKRSCSAAADAHADSRRAHRSKSSNSSPGRPARQANVTHRHRQGRHQSRHDQGQGREQGRRRGQQDRRAEVHRRRRGFTAAPKGKRGKGAAAVKVAEKSAPKAEAKAKDGKKGKSRVQVADARNARK